MTDFDIPEEYTKYTNLINELVSRYTELFSNDIGNFDGADVMALFALLSKTAAELRNVVDELNKRFDEFGKDWNQRT